MSQATAPSGANTPWRDPAESPDVLLTVADVAAWLRLTPKGIYGLVETRRIAVIRAANRLRFRREDVLAFLRENRVAAFSEKTP
jgi:excisionase family DNA binding protein